MLRVPVYAWPSHEGANIPRWFLDELALRFGSTLFR